MARPFLWILQLVIYQWPELATLTDHEVFNPQGDSVGVNKFDGLKKCECEILGASDKEWRTKARLKHTTMQDEMNNSVCVE